MGIQNNGVKFIFNAHNNGASFGESLTIGRLGLRSQRHQLQDLLLQEGIDKAQDITWVTEMKTEDILSLLGALNIDSLDYSDYQNCTIVHDLNNPLPEAYHRKYDAVIEGGTIEHVFNAPSAIKSCMDAVKEGGRIYIMQNGPNFYGHGFYTFGPEFFFSILTPRYGFELEHFLIYDLSEPDKLYTVHDPGLTGESARVITGQPSSVLIQARRIGEGEDFMRSPPNQSGYETLWKEPNDKWESMVVNKKMRKNSPLHGMRWYELWKWNRALKRNAMKRRRDLSFEKSKSFDRFFFDL